MKEFLPWWAQVIALILLFLLPVALAYWDQVQNWIIGQLRHGVQSRTGKPPVVPTEGRA